MGFLCNFSFVHKFVALENIRIQHYPLIPVLKSSLDLVFKVEERDQVPRKGIEFDELVQKFYEGRQRQNPVSLEGCRTLLKRGAVPIPGESDLYVI